MSHSNVTVVTISFNSMAVLPKMLESLPLGTPIVIIDNASDDQTAVQTLAERFGAKLVLNTKNVGFGLVWRAIKARNWQRPSSYCSSTRTPRLRLTGYKPWWPRPCDFPKQGASIRASPMPTPAPIFAAAAHLFHAANGCQGAGRLRMRRCRSLADRPSSCVVLISRLWVALTLRFFCTTRMMICRCACAKVSAR